MNLTRLIIFSYFPDLERSILLADLTENKCNAAIKQTGIENSIRFTGYIPENEPDSLLRTVEFWLYFSL